MDKYSLLTVGQKIRIRLKKRRQNAQILDEFIHMPQEELEQVKQKIFENNREIFPGIDTFGINEFDRAFKDPKNVKIQIPMILDAFKAFGYLDVETCAACGKLLEVGKRVFLEPGSDISVAFGWLLHCEVVEAVYTCRRCGEWVANMNKKIRPMRELMKCSDGIKLLSEPGVEDIKVSIKRPENPTGEVSDAKRSRQKADEDEDTLTVQDSENKDGPVRSHRLIQTNKLHKACRYGDTAGVEDMSHTEIMKRCAGNDTIRHDKKRKRRSNLSSRSKGKIKKQNDRRDQVPRPQVKPGLVICDKQGKINRLQKACRDGDIASVKSYIEEMSHIEIMRRCASKHSALHYAIMHGNIGCAMTVLEHISLTDDERVELSTLCRKHNSPIELSDAVLGNGDSKENECEAKQEIIDVKPEVITDDFDIKQDICCCSCVAKREVAVKEELVSDTEELSVANGGLGVTCPICRMHFFYEKYLHEHIGESHSYSDRAEAVLGDSSGFDRNLAKKFLKVRHHSGTVSPSKCKMHQELQNVEMDAQSEDRLSGPLTSQLELENSEGRPLGGSENNSGFESNSQLEEHFKCTLQMPIRTYTSKKKL